MGFLNHPRGQYPRWVQRHRQETQRSPVQYQYDIERLRPFDTKSYDHVELTLKRALVFAEGRAIALSLVTADGTVTVTMKPSRAKKLGERLLKIASAA